METITKVNTRSQVTSMYLIKKAQMGDKEAIEDIVTRFIPFIIKTCRRIYIKGFELEDLIQIGQVSIIKAINNYKVNRRYAFTTYVVNTVKTNLYRLMKYKVNSVSEISLNAVNNKGYEIIDILPSKDNVEDEIIENEEKRRLHAEINRLSHREKEIIFWFYFENKTLEEYAMQKSICYRAAVERKRRAIKKLRCHMDQK